MASFDLTGKGMTSQRTRDRLAARLREQGIRNEAVLAMIAATPRHIFVDEALAHRAYEDTALPIGFGQTISQPYIVALMSEVLLSEPRSSVLEIGSGSGYQTAILAGLVEQVISVERIQPLQQKADERLRALRLHNARLKYADGVLGWSDGGPYDGIMVTAAPAVLPTALLDQLAIGGRLVAPIGGGSVQELQVYDRTEEGLESQTVEYVKFVPLLKGLQKA